MKSNQNMVIILKKNQSLDDMDKNQSRSHGYKKQPELKLKKNQTLVVINTEECQSYSH